MIAIDTNSAEFSKVTPRGGTATRSIIELINECVDLVSPDFGGDTSVDFMMGRNLLRTPDDYQKSVIEMLAKLRETLSVVESIDKTIEHNEAYTSMMDGLMGAKLSSAEQQLAEEQFQRVASNSMKPHQQMVSDARASAIAPIGGMSMDDLF